MTPAPLQKLTFSQGSGQVWDVTGVPRLIGLAYSGNGKGLNNPAMQYVHNVGVIPGGGYDGEVVTEPQLGPRVFRLTPKPGTDMRGPGTEDRFGFYIHWDNHAHDFSASDGCIIPLMPDTFSKIQDKFDLEVVA